MFTFLVSFCTQGSDAKSWTATWAASPQRVWDPGFILPNMLPARLEDVTIRQRIRISQGGDAFAFEFSNEEGNGVLKISGVKVRCEIDYAHPKDVDSSVTFSGRRSVSIGPGEKRVSDPIDVSVPDLAQLTVDIHLEEASTLQSFHWEGGAYSLIAYGEQLGAEPFPVEETSSARFLLSSVNVSNAESFPLVIAFGDSITDGNGLPPDENERWPDHLSVLLAERSIAVLNSGISGGRLLYDGMGLSGLKRFDRDVLAHPGDKIVILALGINDIAWPGTPFAPDAELVTIEQLILGYRQFIAFAEQSGVRVIGATVTPFKGALENSTIDSYYSARKESLRQELNLWIRQSEAFEAYVDFDRVLHRGVAASFLGSQ